MKSRPALTLADCERICAAALAEAQRNNWIVAVAILDDGGHLLHFARMDGASPANARIAVAKGRTAAESRRNTGKWQERIKDRPELMQMPIMQVLRWMRVPGEFSAIFARAAK